MSDYSSMKATKVKKKEYDGNYEISRSNQRKIKKVFKKSSIMWVIVGAFFAISLVGSFFVCKFVFASDTYQMEAYANGEVDVYVGVDEEHKTYEELGVKCISFGKDYSDKFTVKYYYRDDLTEKEVEVSKVDESIPGIYYAVYEAPAKKYSSVKLIRNIIVTGVED